jgi:hypothetical protein
VFVLLTLLSCSLWSPTTISEQERWFPGCTSADCRRDRTLELWTEAPTDLPAALSSLEDHIERTALIQLLTEAHPGETLALCEVLSDETQNSWCRELNRRPHLRSAKSGADKPRERALPNTPESPAAPTDGKTWTQKVLQRLEGGNPSEGDRAPELTVEHELRTYVALLSAEIRAENTRNVDPFSDLQPTTHTCEHDLLTHTCQTQAASDAASESRFLDSASACLAIEAEKWRAECFFQAAEQAFRSDADLAVRGALDLCQRAGPYREACLAHLSMRIAGRGPSALNSRPESWFSVDAGIQDIVESLGSRDPALTHEMVSRVWTEAANYAYREVSRVTGDPLDLLDIAAHPHIRCAAAWRLWQLEGDADRDLETWSARLTEALDERHSGPVQQRRKRAFGQRIQRMWLEQLPGEEELPVTLFMGTDRRTLGQTAQEDGLICLLESAARQRPPAQAVLLEGLEQDSSRVRWTSARLIQQIDGKGVLVTQLADHSDPLVRGRSERRNRDPSGQASSDPRAAPNGPPGDKKPKGGQKGDRKKPRPGERRPHTESEVAEP